MPYFGFVLFLTGVVSALLYPIGVISKSNGGLVFCLMFLYGLSVISLAFLITPFFDRAKVGYISFACR